MYTHYKYMHFNHACLPTGILITTSRLTHSGTHTLLNRPIQTSRTYMVHVHWKVTKANPTEHNKLKQTEADKYNIKIALTSISRHAHSTLYHTCIT